MSSSSSSSSTSTTTKMVNVKFLPFTSTVDSPFWVQYNHLKLEKIKLNEDPIDIYATFNIGESRLQCIETSLDTTESISNDRIAVPGKLIGLNTLESFQKIDKNKFISDYYDKNKILQFVLLTFCDLKAHKVLYWFGIPALMNKSPIQAELLLTGGQEDSSSSSSVILLKDLTTRYHQLRMDCLNDIQGLPAFFVFDKTTENGGGGKMSLLNKDCLSSISNIDNVVFGFVDSVAGAGNTTTTAAGTTTSSESIIMGWPLRTMLSYLSLILNLGGQTVTIISYRPTRLRKITKTTTTEGDNSSAALLTPGSNDDHNSIVFRIQVPNDYEYASSSSGGGDGDDSNKTLKVVGWELNARQKPGPRWCNLRPLLDSNHLAIQAADLNLKLMKWRMLPELNVNLLQSTKVLLLGAGTLGCSVARTLLGWGIRNFTILDYGNVSYSNPVRQNLFVLDDCHYENGSGKPKAQATCDALKQIAADVTANAIKLSIPMPGHSAETLESITESVTKLDNLIKDTDIVFLLTDTRESRWLPTLMSASHDKLLINAALGLDSWLVMRHGGGIDDEVEGAADHNTKTNRLGCYFCNDIVAPENSTKNRTLDQQCTVTRPGLAPIASSMAVELMVSTLHHPKQQHAPAPSPMAANKGFSPSVSNNNDESATSPLGVMPHQIRGSIVSYTMMTPTVPAFKCCTACSPPVVAAYKQNKLDLVYQACQSKDGSYLENISGLTEFRAEAAEKLASMDDMDMDDDDASWD